MWTGEEMIVWGGCLEEECQTRFSDGAAFDPTTDQWGMIAESPLDGRWYHLAAWTGSEMLIIGGTQSNRTGAAYSPQSDTWRLLPDAPFGVGYERPDGAALRDYRGAVWTGDRLVIWRPQSDQVAAYSPDTNTWTDLAPAGLDVDLGVLRWNGTDLVALGALTSVFPDRVPLQGVRLVGQTWEPLPAAELWDERLNTGARPYLSGWAGDVLVAFTEFGLDAGRTLTYRPALDSWSEIDSVPLSGSEGWPEPITIDNRLLVFHYGQAAIYDAVSDSWSLINIPFAEAGRAVWTGSEVLFWGEVCCYGTPGFTPFEMQAWRYTPPES